MGRTLIWVALAATPCLAQAITVPAVPYLPQPPELCGGASLAMVLRYWGVPNVRPEHFAGSLLPGGTGITQGVLQDLAEAQGFQAFAFRGEPAEARSHLDKGRPLITLLASAPGRHHYVVMLAWANERLLIHDPAVGPFRIIPEGEWLRRWDTTGRWALLVLPPDGAGRHAPESSPPSPEATGPARDDACGGLVQPGIDLALAGSVDAAREQLSMAASWCPHSSAPPREMAALEFRRESWLAAAEHAAEAVRRDPLDRFAWKLLATSRFLAGRREGALAAWNRVGEPRVDLVRIEGFERMRSHVVYGYVGEDAGTMLTPERLRRVQRRMGALPAVQLSRVSYLPQRGGTAQLDVRVVERPAFSSPGSVLLRAALRAASERAIGVDASGLAPSGDIVRVAGQWQPNRSYALLSASAPHFLALPGIVTAEILWDEQSYRLQPPPIEDGPVRERRQRASLSLAHWWAADTRAAVTVAADDWRGRGRYLSLGGDVEQRLLGDHVAVGASAAGWWSEASAPFHAASARWSIRTGTTSERPRVHIDAAYHFTSTRAPRALWPGAGTGAGRGLLLRAHPLVRGGVIDGAGFGRAIMSMSAQAERPMGSLGPARVGAVAFVDAAKILAPTRRKVIVDVGAGVRVRPPGWNSALRVDLATPWGGVQPRLSAGWHAEWR